jgi:hypothetical protein
MPHEDESDTRQQREEEGNPPNLIRGRIAIGFENFVESQTQIEEDQPSAQRCAYSQDDFSQ